MKYIKPFNESKQKATEGSGPYFQLKKDVGKLKKGTEFGCYGGLVHGVKVDDGDGKIINFDDKEYFKFLGTEPTVSESAQQVFEAEKIDKSKLDGIRSDINNALADLCKRRGWKKLAVGMITYFDNGFSAAVKCNTGLVTPEMRAWIRQHEMPDDLIGRPFRYKKDVYVVDSVVPYAKYPVESTRESDGATVGFHQETVKAGLI